MVRQGCPTLQIGSDLFCVIPKRSVDLLVEVCVSVVDEVDILVAMDGPPPAEVRLLPLLVDKIRNEAFDGSLRWLRSCAVC